MNAAVQLPFPRSIRRMTGSPSLTPSGKKKEGKKKKEKKERRNGLVKSGLERKREENLVQP